MEAELELREAAMKGNLPSLLELLGKDMLLLDRIMTGNQTETPLHIAAMLGHLEFVKEVLARKAELAKVQNSQGLTPLHLAAAKGYLTIVESLLSVSPEICFIHDKYKRNPLHVAAMKGHVDVLVCLVRARPDAARSVAEHGQTILHLCVKHNKLEALKFLIDIINDDQFINSGDEDGNTILHLAAIDRQSEAVDFLVNKGVNPSITNSRGFTVLGLLTQGQRVDRALDIMDSVPQILDSHDQSGRIVHARSTVTAFHQPEGEENNEESKRKWQESMHETLMVVAMLLSAMAFQAGISPPGGTWQDDLPKDNDGPRHFARHSVTADMAPSPSTRQYYDPPSHSAGHSIMANKDSDLYEAFVIYNTISFVASLSLILFRISGRNSKQRPNSKKRSISTWIAMLTLWVAIICTASTYAISVTFSSPGIHIADGVLNIVPGCIALMVLLLLLVNVVKLILKVVRKVLKSVRKFSKRPKQKRSIV